MSNLFSKIALGTYRGVGMAIYPFMGPLLRYRASKGKEDRTRRYERYGYPSTDKPAGPIIWFHAASVGESLAVIPLIEHVHSLGINSIMTTGTVTSAQLMRQRLPKGAFHQYVPLDVRPALERFLDHWKPDLSIFTESEIWPMTIMELSKRRIPRILVNARMSNRSYKRWRNASGLAEKLFENFSHVIAQSENDGNRFRDLGAVPVDVTGNLKVKSEPLPFDQNERDRLARQIGNRTCWLAASTHEGEEALIGRVHQQLANNDADLLTIIAPRHPSRVEAVAAELQEAGLSVVIRSSNDPITPTTDIYLCDTIGEMGLFYDIVPIAFMGKSLVGSGGQNPLEPAVCNTAIVSGQYVESFRDTYKKLLEAGAVRLVSNEKMLADNLRFLLANTGEREKMIEAGKTAIAEMSGGLEKTTHILDTYFFPLTVKRDLEELG